MQHFKLFAAISVTPQSMLSNSFAIPHMLKVWVVGGGGYVNVLAFSKNQSSLVMLLIYEKRYFDEIPSCRSWEKIFCLIQLWIYYFSLMDRATATHRCMAFSRQCLELILIHLLFFSKFIYANELML